MFSIHYPHSVRCCTEDLLQLHLGSGDFVFGLLSFSRIKENTAQMLNGTRRITHYGASVLNPPCLAISDSYSVLSEIGFIAPQCHFRCALDSLKVILHEQIRPLHPSRIEYFLGIPG